MNTNEHIIMIDTSEINTIKWDEKKGESLKKLRGKVSRRKLSILVGCSHQYLQLLENGGVQSISFDLLNKICNSINIPVGKIIKTYSLVPSL